MDWKFLLLAAYFGGVLLYGLLNTRRNGTYDLRTRVDGYIPFIPIFVIPYFGLFAFVPVALYLLFPTALIFQYLTALIIASYLAAFAWYFFPARMYPPHITGKGIYERLLALLYRGDPHANGFPSSHVFTSTITSFYLSSAFPHFSILIWAIGASIAFSTLLIKHHRIADLVGGVAWAVAAIIIAPYCVGYHI